MDLQLSRGRITPKPTSNPHSPPAMASFLSDAKARIQHTNKLSLAPKDIRNLAEIISTEKNVLSASSRLSVDYRKAADALKEWGLNEGDDLADILPKLAILLGHLADAQSRFSDHDGTYRIHFKSIRMREEALAALKKSRETIQAKITALEKKDLQITKMSSENKDLPALTTRLQEARSELISLENSVAIEEARLSDFKRETVREGLGLRLGAMLELAEKMTIVCEFGKMLTAEVPVERTAPGTARQPYCAANKTQSVVEEAQRCLTQVVFNPSHSAAPAHPATIEDHAEGGPAASSSKSPHSESEHPASLHQASHPPSDASHSLPMELPPLYFSQPAPNDPPLDSSARTAPSSSSAHHPNSAPGPVYAPHDNYSSSLPYTAQASSEAHLPTHHGGYNSVAEPGTTSPPLSAAAAAGSQGSPTGMAARLSRTPAEIPGAESHDRPSYIENVFYVRGLNGAPLSAGPGHPSEPVYSPSSLYSPPPSAHNKPSSDAAGGGGSGQAGGHGLQHPSALATPPPSVPRSLGPAHAFGADDHGSAVVQPLQINKRDTATGLEISRRNS
ncbi:hypothetical protein PtB15_8B374 [Puccinia triticina]|nr:hypothetical protein PtB15_8B374 [Puccinia triticina]